MSEFNDHGVLLSGTAYMKQAGVNAGFVEIGNVTALQLKSGADKKERISKKKESFGQALDSIVIPKPVEISIEFDTFNKQNFAMMLMGNAADLSAAAVTVADEVLTVQKGEWIQLANANIDTTQTIGLKTESGSTIKAEDYTINASLGLLKLNDSATQTTGDKLKISYKTRAGAGFKVEAGTLTGLNLEIVLDMQNRASGKTGRLEIYQAAIAADGDFDWLADDWGNAKFSGSLVTPTGKSAAYTLTWYD